MEREVDIRKRILKDYCKTEDDFATLREYNDYLEEVSRILSSGFSSARINESFLSCLQIETIVFNLVKNNDVLETSKKIEQYKKENSDQIKRARILGNPHIHELDEILRQERLQAQERDFEKTVLEKEELIRRQKTKESLIDNLMFSDIDANAIDRKSVV